MGLLSKQQILDYEVSMIEYSADGLSKPYYLANSKYGIWELEQKIKNTMHDKQYTVRWIGNSQTAYLQAYVYVLLAMCTKSDDLILSLKNGLYVLGQKYLQKQHQKLLVEFLCLIQYTRDKFLFLRKYPQVQQLIVSILKFIESQNFSQFQRLNDTPTKNRKSIYDKFHQIFSFIQVFHPNQYTYVFIVQDIKINVIVQKECFFIVQAQKGQIIRQQKYFSKSSSKKQIVTFKKQKKRDQKTKSNQKYKRNIFNVQNRVKSNFQSRRKQQNWKSFNSIQNQIKKNKQNKSFDNQNQESDKQPSIIVHLQNKIVPQMQESFQQLQYMDLQASNFQQQKKYQQQREFIRKMQKSQKRKNEIWNKMQEEYYQRKRKITQKNKNMIVLKKLANSKQQEGQKMLKQRKTSFNSYSGAYNRQKIKDKRQDDSTKDKSKSTVQSTPSLVQNKLHYKERKGSLKTQSISFQFRKLRKNNSNENFLNQDFKLSVIQQQNRAKFLNKKEKTNKIKKQERNQHQIQSNLACASNRETITSNKSITFHYLNKQDLEQARLYHQSRQIEV